jgi:hypothetical protein
MGVGTVRLFLRFKNQPLACTPPDPRVPTTDCEAMFPQENYAQKEQPECTERVKTLYRDLGLEVLYQNYKESSYQKLIGTIEKETKKAKLPMDLFLEFTSRIYHFDN